MDFEFADVNSKLMWRNANFCHQDFFDHCKKREDFAVVLRKTKRFDLILQCRKEKLTEYEVDRDKGTEFSEDSTQMYFPANCESLKSTQNWRLECCGMLDKAIYAGNSVLVKTQILVALLESAQRSAEIRTELRQTDHLNDLISLSIYINAEVSVCALNLLSEIASNSLVTCTQLLKYKLVKMLKEYISLYSPPSHSLVFSISNLIKHISLYSLNYSKSTRSHLVSFCVKLLKISTGPLQNIINSLCLVCFNDKNSIEKLLDLDGFSYAISQYKAGTIFYKDLSRLIECITTGDKTQILRVIELNVLDLILEQYVYQEPDIKVISISSLANIATSHKKNNSLLVQHEIFAVALQDLTHYSLSVAVEASFLIRYFLMNSFRNDKIRVLTLGLFEKILEGFDQNDDTCKNNLLISVYSLLSLNRKSYNDFENLIDISQCGDKISQLSTHPNIEIRQKSEFILQCFFDLACN